MGSLVQAYRSYSIRARLLTNSMTVVCDVDEDNDEVKLIGINNKTNIKSIDDIVIKIPSFVNKIGYQPFRDVEGRIKVEYAGDKLTDISGLFENASKIERIDMKGFNTSKITKMNRLFFDCKRLTSLYMMPLDISLVEEMSELAAGCEKLVIVYMPYSSINCMKNMENMFNGCNNLECVISEISKIPKECIVDEHTKELLGIK